MVDSLKIFDTLKAADIPEPQARAMTLAIQDSRSESIQDMRAMIASEITAAEARFGAKLAETKVEILRWNFVFWVGQLAAMAGLLKLMK